MKLSQFSKAAAFFLCSGTLLIAQNTVLESVTYVTVAEYAAGAANVPDVSATDDGGVNQMSLETFEELLAEAYAEGRGGVIDFENSLRGDSLRAIDKTLVNAYVRTLAPDGFGFAEARLRLYDDPSVGVDDDPYVGGPLDGLDGSDERFLYDLGDRVEDVVLTLPIDGYDGGSGEIALVDPGRIIVVEDRVDREFSSDEASSLSEEQRIIYAQLNAIYGEDSITIRRGPLHITEGALADREQPGTRAYPNTDPANNIGGQAPINDEFYFLTQFVEGDRRPLSGNSSMAGGANSDATAKDMLFDPRDNIKALGFTLMSFGNFQYWQGLGGEPDNADNILVTAYFSDGTITEYRGTTQQSTGGADTFFGIEAPFGSALTRLQMRVVGRNFRTFTYIDDLAFITEPSAPYLSDGAELNFTIPYAATGRLFIRQLEFQRSPDSVEFFPALEDASVTLASLGLNFDFETGLISGVPNVIIPPGENSVTYTLPLEMTNAIGSRTENVTFQFRNPAPGSTAPEIDITRSPGTALATIGRDFSYTLVTNLTDEEQKNLQVILIAEQADGSYYEGFLSDLNLSLSDGVLSGKVLSSRLAGDYRLNFYAVTPNGSVEYSVELTVVPPTTIPNFDAAAGDTKTDLVFFDDQSGVISIALFTDEEGGGLGLSDPFEIASALPTDTEIFLGDFNGDANTDIVTYSPSSGEVWLHAISGSAEGILTSQRLLQTLLPNSGWEILGVGDLNGDTFSDLILQNASTKQTLAWLLLAVGDETPSEAYIFKSSYLFIGEQAKVYELLAIGDLNGDGSADLVWSDPETGEFIITPFDGDKFLSSQDPTGGLVRTERTIFTMEDGYDFLGLADVNGDGLDDMLWLKQEAGLLAVWQMSGVTPPTSFFAKAGEQSASGYTLGDAIAGDLTIPVPEDLGGLEEFLDLNGDNTADLLFGSGNSLAATLLNGSDFTVSYPEFMEDGVTPRPQVELDDTTGEIVTAIRGLSIGSRFLTAGEDIGLAADESLNDVSSFSPANGDYQIFEQARDGENNLLWDLDTDPFHALPVADTSSPVGDDNVWDDGYIQAEQALRAYDIYVRTRVESNGRPAASSIELIDLGIPGVPPVEVKIPGVVKTAPQAVALEDSQDLAWTPMATALDGDEFVDGVDGVSDYDARGNRGFLQQIDSSGELVFKNGQPVYVPWRNASGRSILKQSIINLVEGAIQQVVGSEDGEGFWLAGDELTVAYSEAPDGESAEEFIYANRRAVTNAIYQAIALLNPSANVPEPLPELPGDFVDDDDFLGFDALTTANENSFERTTQTSLLMVRDLVFDEVESLFVAPLFSEDDILEDQIQAMETVIIEALQLVSLDAASLTTDDFEVFPDSQFSLGVRRAITDGMKAAVAAAGLVPDGETFTYDPENLALALFGNGDSDWATAIEFAITDAMNATTEKLQSLDVRVAIRDAVNEAFGTSITTESIPLDLVFDGSHPFNRRSASDIQIRIEDAIVLGVAAASGVNIDPAELAFVYGENASATERAVAIRSAIVKGIELAGGSIALASVNLDYPEDIAIGSVTELFAAVDVDYSSSQSAQENADAIRAGILAAFNSQFAQDLIIADIPEVVYYTDAELETILINALTDIINQAGGSTATVAEDVTPLTDLVDSESDASFADVEQAVRDSILAAVSNPFLGLDWIASDSNAEGDALPGFLVPHGADLAMFSAAGESYLADSLFGNLFPTSSLNASDLEFDLTGISSLKELEGTVESVIQTALPSVLPISSYPSVVDSVDISLLDESEYVSLVLDERVAIEVEALQRALQALGEQPFAFPDLAAAVAFEDYLNSLEEFADQDLTRDEVGIYFADYLADYLASVLSQAALGEITNVGNQVAGTSLVLNGDLPVDWARTLSFVVAAVDAAFPSEAPVLTASDGFSGNTFAEQGDAVLAAVADAISQASGQTVTVGDLSGNAFPTDVLLYELDYIRDTANTVGDIIIPDGFIVVASGDYDNIDGTAQDLLLWNPYTGEFLIYTQNGVETTAIINPASLNAGISGKIPLGFEALDGPPPVSMFVLWQRDNFGSETSLDADPGDDPDMDRASNLLEYASGVESVFGEFPTPPVLSMNESGDFELEFYVRDSDPDLVFTVLGSTDLSADLSDWDPVAYTVLETVEISETTHLYRVSLGSIVDPNAFFRIDYQLD